MEGDAIYQTVDEAASQITSVYITTGQKLGPVIYSKPTTKPKAQTQPVSDTNTDSSAKLQTQQVDTSSGTTPGGEQNKCKERRGIKKWLIMFGIMGAIMFVMISVLIIVGIAVSAKAITGKMSH